MIPKAPRHARGAFVLNGPPNGEYRFNTRKEETHMYDVIIIGAGVVGGMIARRLSAFDLKICILDKENDVARGATAANSAIVHAGFDAKAGSMKARMNVRGSQLMEKVCADLTHKGIRHRA